MKTCSRCGIEKPLTAFSPRKGAADGLQYWCRSCLLDHNKARYASDAEFRAHMSITAKQRRARYAWVADLKLNGCSVCGFSGDVALLDFHHPNDDKAAEVSHLVTIGAPRNVVEAEIAKCVVLCKSCHARHHALEKRAA